MQSAAEPLEPPADAPAGRASAKGSGRGSPASRTPAKGSGECSPAGSAPASRGAGPGGSADRHFVTALARGLEVLACFRSGNRTLGNAEIAERCKLPKSTVSRLTATLTRLGYLIQTGGKYRLGTASLSLGSAMLTRLDVRHSARPMMQELANYSGGMVSLGTRDRLSMIYIENCRSSAALTLSLDVGSRIPVVRTAIGRAWMAVASERERHEVMDRVAALDPDAWPAIQEGITASLADYRRLGVTCAFGDWQPDVNAIARAFQPGGGLPPMAISCGGPAYTLSREFLLAEVRPLLVEAVRQLEATLLG